MRTNFIAQAVCAAAFVVCISSLSWAQNETHPPETAVTPEAKQHEFSNNEIVVTATKSKINRRETGASVTIITDKELEQRGKENVIDALKDVPGLTITQNSVFGGMAGVYMRGGKSGNVLVLVDGVEVNDPSNPDRSFDFSNITTDNIERIEIIRGPQSMLYGSDATGGVINIITKKGSGDPKLGISFEGGSYSTFKESLSLRGGSERSNYSFSLARTDSKGIPKARDIAGSGSTLKPAHKSYENTTLSSRLGMNPFGKSWVNFSLRYTDALTHVPEDAYYEDPDRKNYSKTLSAMLDFYQPVFDWWSHTLSLSYAKVQRKDIDKPNAGDMGSFVSANSWFEGSIRKVDWQHNFTMGSINEINAGIDVKEERGSSLSYYDMGFGPATDVLPEKALTTVGYYLQDQIKLWKRFFTTGGVRLDHHELFGNTVNYKVSTSIIVPYVETQLKANYGTAFKSPSISQLYDPYSGNADLKEEKNISYDAGFEQPVFGRFLTLGAVYFHNRYKDMISFNPAPPFQNINIGKVETQGVEATLNMVPVKNLVIAAFYTYTKTEDLKKKEQLLRRPEHQGGLNINWTFLEKANLNFNMTYVGKKKDYWYNYSSYTTVYVTDDDYLLFDLVASYTVMNDITIYGKIENLTNEDYQTVAGYNTPGRSYYGGVRASF